MHLDIIRIKKRSGPDGTFGTLSLDGTPFGATCEQSWNDNAPGVSCIPVGDYVLQPYDSPKHGRTVVFHNPVLGVYGTPAQIPMGKTGRSLCEIHSANWPHQLKGCVAPGELVCDLAPHGLGVTNSRETMARLMARWGNRQGLTATIRDDG